jgi:hypothetical protein
VWGCFFFEGKSISITEKTLNHQQLNTRYVLGWTPKLVPQPDHTSTAKVDH